MRFVLLGRSGVSATRRVAVSTRRTAPNRAPCCVAVLLVSVLAGPAHAQQDVLTNDDIVLMTASGLADELIIGLIEVAEVAFDLSETGTTALLEAGVSDDVLIAMLGRISVPVEVSPPAEPPAPEDVAAEGTRAGDTPGVAGDPTGSSTSSTPANADVGRAAERGSPWPGRWKWLTAAGAISFAIGVSVYYDSLCYQRSSSGSRCHLANFMAGAGLLTAATGGTGWIYTLLRGDDDGEPSSTVHVGVDPRRVQMTFRKIW